MKKFQHSVLNERTLGGGYKSIPEDPLDPECILQRALACNKKDDRKLVMEFGPVFFCYRHPSSADLFCMQIMLETIHSGMLNYEIEFVDTEPEIDKCFEDTGPFRGRTVESAEHKGMKLWVKKHLAGKGIDATDEISHLGYKVDVGSIKDRVFIECGDTEPRKVFEFLKNNENIGILQYSSEFIVWFISTPEFLEYAEKEWLKAFGIPNPTLHQTPDSDAVPGGRQWRRL
jgi:hypothetical protein